MRLNEWCPNCGETLIEHMEEITLWHPGYWRRERIKYAGWYECENCGRTYVATTLKRFRPSHVRDNPTKEEPWL
jgi:ribosomal protein S27AE